LGLSRVSNQQTQAGVGSVGEAPQDPNPDIGLIVTADNSATTVSFPQSWSFSRDPWRAHHLPQLP